MSKQRTEINPIRADRVKIIMQREKITQSELAKRIFQTQQNVSRIMQKKQPLTEETAKLIVKAFPDYRLAWLMGYDDDMTVNSIKKKYSDRIDAANSAAMTLLDFSVKEVCLREGLEVPTLDNLTEFLLLEAQLKDFAVSLVWNYIKHRDYSNFWSLIDQAGTKQ